MYDLIIIGGGPAAITAGIYAARKKLKTLLIANNWGGQMKWTNRIENYPGFSLISGQELIDKMVGQLKECTQYDMELKEDTKANQLTLEEDRIKVEAGQTTYESKALIIATGARYKKLGVVGEEEFANKGVSYCPTCDGPVFEGKKVAVVGGGNAGLESALDLTNYAEFVYVVEYLPELTADGALKEQAEKNSKIKIITGAEAKEIKGGKFVNGLIYQDRKSGQDEEIKLEGVFVEIGYVANSSLVENMLKLNEVGEIKIDRDNQTSSSNIFACGDVTDVRDKQIVVAAAEGAKAALSAYNYLR